MTTDSRCASRSDLATAQADLLQALWCSPGAGPAFLAKHAQTSQLRGLQVYQSNGHLLAERALAAAFPVLAQMLGGESFGALARAFWHAQPPQQGDMAQWGGELSAYVRASEQLASEAYLADVAAAEWALHRAATATDGLADLGTLSLLTQHDPGEVRLRLSGGLWWLGSAWPVVTLLWAHAAGRDAASLGEAEHWPSLGDAGDRLRACQGEAVLVWRKGFQPCARHALPGEMAFLQSLQQGQSLAQALQAGAGLDFAQWLAQAVRSGLLLTVALAA